MPNDKTNQKDFEKFIRENAKSFDITVPQAGVYRYYITIDFKPNGLVIKDV